MTEIVSKRLKTRRCRFFCLSLVLVSNAALAEPAINENLLGMSEPALRESFDSVSTVTPPQRGPRGERGRLRLPNSELAGLNFETIFYFKQGSMARIEQRWTAVDSDCDAPYAAVLAKLSSRYGSAVRADDVDGAGLQRQFAAWTADNFQVAAYNIPHPDYCEIQVSFKPHQDVDA